MSPLEIRVLPYGFYKFTVKTDDKPKVDGGAITDSGQAVVDPQGGNKGEIKATLTFKDGKLTAAETKVNVTPGISGDKVARRGSHRSRDGRAVDPRHGLSREAVPGRTACEGQPRTPRRHRPHLGTDPRGRTLRTSRGIRCR